MGDKKHLADANQPQFKPTPPAKHATPGQPSHLLSNCCPDPRHYLGSNEFLAFCLLSRKILWVKRNSEADSHILPPPSCHCAIPKLEPCKQILSLGNKEGTQQWQGAGGGSLAGCSPALIRALSLPAGIQEHPSPAAERAFQVHTV